MITIINRIKEIKVGKVKLFSFILFIGLFLFSFFLTEKFSQSFHFVDEEDHIVLAHFMNKGYKLYDDLSSNHQPLVYFFSSFTQKFFKPDNLFLLIKRTREAVFLYSFSWSLVLFFVFGPVFLLFSLFFELTKFFLFGNLLLMESLAVYPLLFILGQTFRVVFYAFKPKKWQSLIFGLANFLVVFNLLPLIPSLIILNLIYFIKTKELKRALVGFIVPTFVLFLFISPLDWFRETVFYNFKYVVPVLSSIKNKTDYFILFLFPIISFFKSEVSVLSSFIKFFSILLIGCFIIYFFNNKGKKISQKKNYLFYFLILVSVLLLNNRVLTVGKMYYEGFHLLPWYGALIFFDLLMVELIFKKIKGIGKFLSVLILGVSGICLLLNSNMPYRQKIDKNREHNINYYPYYLMGIASKAIASPGDRLAVFPHESLIYWQSGLKPASRQIVYYDWSYGVPVIKKEMDQVFIKDPPEFLYYNFPQVGPSRYSPLMEKAMAENYSQVMRFQEEEGKMIKVEQNLYIKKEKVKEISQNQWLEWEKLGFFRIK